MKPSNRNKTLPGRHRYPGADPVMKPAKRVPVAGRLLKTTRRAARNERGSYEAASQCASNAMLM